MEGQHGGDIYRHPGVMDFSANINPLPTPAAVLEAARDGLDYLSHYPDGCCTSLRNALAEKLSCPAEDIICGNGAADLLFTLALACKPRRALLVVPGFSEYEAALRSVGTEIIYYPLREREAFSLTEGCFSAMTEEIDMMFLCSPNNPTGNLIEKKLLLEIAGICEKKKILLVVDECFQDFLPDPRRYSLLPELAGRKNIFLLKSFTKMFGLPGLRLGYGVTRDRALIGRMEMSRQPWPVSIPAQMAGTAALEQEEFIQNTRKYISREREFLCRGLRSMGWKVYDSSANYIFFRGEEGLQERLLECGILIRDCSNYRGLERGYYRIAVKQHEENEELLHWMGRNG